MKIELQIENSRKSWNANKAHWRQLALAKCNRTACARVANSLLALQQAGDSGSPTILQAFAPLGNMEWARNRLIAYKSYLISRHEPAELPKNWFNSSIEPRSACVRDEPQSL